MAIFVAAGAVFFRKSICGLLVLSLLMPFTVMVGPRWAEAGISSGSTVIDIVTNLNTGIGKVIEASTNTATWKEVFWEIAKQALARVAKKALEKATESTVNWINQGFDGKPLFLQNPQSFFTGIEHDEIKVTVNEIGGDLDKYPWGRGAAKNKVREARAEKKSTTAERIGVFDLNTRFNLNSPAEIEQFYNDTRVGGWDGWTAMVDNPNNNPIGFDLALSNDMQKRVDQKTENWEKSIQGMFLPTQKCADPSSTTREIEDAARNSGDMEEYERVRCKRWEDTTPSTLVAGKIASALTSGDRQSELNAALGNSLSAAFGALLNQFIDQGLAALQTNTEMSGNAPPPEDTWEFMGETFSAGSDDSPPAFSSWANAKETIVLDDFKDQVNKSIDRVNKRMSSTQETVNIMNAFGEKSMALDQCAPGPDMRWESRFSRELRRNSKKLEKKAEKDSEEKAEMATTALANLETAAEAFGDYEKNAVMTALPSSILMMDWLSTLGRKQDVLKSFKQRVIDDREKLARLTAIQSSLNTLPQDPDTGMLDTEMPAPVATEEEKGLLAKLWSQYKVMEPKLPQDDDVEEAGVEWDIAKDWGNEVANLTQTCERERETAGWPKGAGEKSNNPGWAYGSEFDMFCGWPITDEYGKYPDGTYIYPGTDADRAAQKVEVNAQDVYNENDIDISCDIIYYSVLSDYSRPDE